MKVHGMKAEDITPEMKQKIRGLIRATRLIIFYLIKSLPLRPV